MASKVPLRNFHLCDQITPLFTLVSVVFSVQNKRRALTDSGITDEHFIEKIIYIKIEEHN